MNIQDKRIIALNKESNKEYNFLLSKDGKLESEIEKLDGLDYPVEIISCHQNEYELLVNGVSYSFSVETPFSLQRKKTLLSQVSESTTIRLKAPMPGKILEVMVKTGDTVKAGDTLLILEAMKMQNAILASTKGIIKKVLVKEGDTTSKSDLLIELEKEV